MDFQMSHNERLMEQIFRLYAVLRRGPGLGGEGEKGGRPSAQNRILLMLGESDGTSASSTFSSRTWAVIG